MRVKLSFDECQESSERRGDVITQRRLVFTVEFLNSRLTRVLSSLTKYR
jgi:hypothetical protein